MSIFHNGKQIQDLYHNGKQIESLYHNGKQIYQRYLPLNTVLWEGNEAFSPDNETVHGGGSLISTSNPIELSGKLSNIRNGLIFNFGGNVYCNTSNSWSDQPDTSTKIAKANLTSKQIVVEGKSLWYDETVYVQMTDETHLIFTSSDDSKTGPMSTCIGNVNSYNNTGGDGYGYYFSICKSIIAY